MSKRRPKQSCGVGEQEMIENSKMGMEKQIIREEGGEKHCKAVEDVANCLENFTDNGHLKKGDAVAEDSKRLAKKEDKKGRRTGGRGEGSSTRGGAGSSNKDTV